MELPSALRHAVDRLLEGTPLEALRAASERLSQRYRSETRDGRPHLDDVAAVKAYLAARLPATYAAVRASMAHVAEACPDFAPGSLLDVGAGPGTVLWAAADCWEGLEQATLIEASETVRNAGKTLAAGHSAAGCRLARRGRHENNAGRREGRSRDAVLRARRACARRNRAAGRPVVGTDGRLAARRRARHAGRLVTHPRRPRPTDRGGSAHPRPLPAPRTLPARRSRLVPFLAPRRTDARSPAEPRVRTCHGRTRNSSTWRRPAPL